MLENCSRVCRDATQHCCLPRTSLVWWDQMGPTLQKALSLVPYTGTAAETFFVLAQLQLVIFQVTQWMGWGNILVWYVFSKIQKGLRKCCLLSCRSCKVQFFTSKGICWHISDYWIWKHSFGIADLWIFERIISNPLVCILPCKGIQSITTSWSSVPIILLSDTVEFWEKSRWLRYPWTMLCSRSGELS